MKKIYCVISLFLAIVLLISVDKIEETNAYSIFDDNSAKSYIVVDESGNVLLEKNSNEKRQVASICKLMTTLITLEYIEDGSISLDDKFVASERACAVEGSQAFLDAGSEYLVGDLLKSVIVASANDSAIVLAEGIGGNESNFVNMMNARAKALGMGDTKYTNSTGLPEGEQYSTAVDTAKLLGEVSKYNIYKKDCKIWMDKLIHQSGRETELVNTNRLIKYYPNCLTGKTGFTDEAGYCLSSTAEKNNLHLTCVVLGCDSSADRFAESIELYNYAFSNFVSQKVVDCLEELDINIPVIGGVKETIKVRPQEDFYVTKRVGENEDISIEYEIVESLKAPVDNGEKVGDLLVISNGRIIKTINIIADEDVEKMSFADIVDKLIDNFNRIGN